MQSHYVMLGVFVAATLGAGYLMTGRDIAMPAFALERSVTEPADLSNLLRFGDRDYDVAFDASIDTVPISTATVKKIAFGNESEVSIVTTSTGTYSTDSLISPYVLYPGVSVNERSAMAAAAKSQYPAWSMKVGPMKVYQDELPSFIVIAPIPAGGEAIITDLFTCVVKSPSTVICI